MNAEALIGTTLGTCTLQKLIGQGGMGAVFLAQQSRPRRPVAVKVLFPMVRLMPQQQSAFLERFRRETDAAASLDHPNILPVHEYGERDGLAYLVMPYISGGTLRDELERERQLSLPMVVHYLDQMASALEAAHTRGVIHRDIKPANMLMTPEKRLLLSDFGLVKVISDGQTQPTPLTGIGTPMGTPDYMAPEQVIGTDVDARADIYALGVILYQMVTGELPFKGQTPMQVAMQHLQVAPLAPRRFRPELPLAAEQVMLQALAKRPSDRYAQASDLANAFRLSLTAAGVTLGDGTGSLLAPTQAAAISFTTPRGLLDPAWQNMPRQQAQAPTAENAGNIVTKQPGIPPIFSAPGMVPRSPSPATSMRKNDIVAQTRMTLPSFTGLLMPETTPQPQPSAGRHTPFPSPAPSPLPMQGGDTPLPPTRSLLGRKGLLRPLDAPLSEQSPGQQAQQMPDMPEFSPAPGAMQHADSLQNMASSQFPSMTQIPFPPAPSMSMLPASPSVSVPVSPLPISQTLHTETFTQAGIPTPTGTLTTVYPGQGPTMRLTQSMRVVKMPVAGQPGRYVTGLLPAPPASAPADSSTPNTQTLAPSFLRSNLKRIVLITAVLLVLIGSGTFWFLHAHTPSAYQTQGTTAATPNASVTAFAQASATADANIIFTDPLSTNSHNWPVSTSGGGPPMYVFKDGAYHVTAVRAGASALALLPPDEQLPSSFVYTLTAEEIKGDDTTVNNQFGMVFHLTSHQNSTQFYAFEVANTPGGEYEFWKYDDSYGPTVDPWTKIWSHPFGSEYHYGHGTAGRNTLSVALQGTKYTFIVNSKTLGSAQDDTLKGGQIGMLVNWSGTEIAFSNLVLQYK